MITCSNDLVSTIAGFVDTWQIGISGYLPLTLCDNQTSGLIRTTNNSRKIGDYSHIKVTTIIPSTHNGCNEETGKSAVKGPGSNHGSPTSATMLSVNFIKL